jgi:hypothetical protein
MNHLDTLFGPLHMTKVATVNVEALGKVQDVYMAKIKPHTTDATIAVAMVDYGVTKGSLVLLRELPWNVLTVRSYPSHQALSEAVHNVVTRQTLSKLTSQKLPKVSFGDLKDIDLATFDSFREYVIYHGVEKLPFSVALHNDGHEDLPRTIEFIPAIGTLNFTLKKE